MFKAVGNVTYIQSNKRKTIFLFIILFIMLYLFLFGIYLLFHKTSIPASAPSIKRALIPNGGFGRELDRYVLAIIWDAWKAFFWKSHFIIVLAASWIIIGGYAYRKLIMYPIRATKLTCKKCARAYNLLETLSITAGITMPSLYLTKTQAINAFSIGLNENFSSIVVTQGLLDTLDDSELNAVLAHEVTHIKNGDTMTLVTAVLITGTMTYICELIILFFSGTGYHNSAEIETDDPDSTIQDYSGDASRFITTFLQLKPIMLLTNALSLFMAGFIWISALMVRFSISKTREYQADAGAVELTENPDALISALLKIEENTDIPYIPSSAMQMCFDNPRTDFMRIFATHPSVEARIRYLEEYYGGKRPSEQKIMQKQDELRWDYGF